MCLLALAAWTGAVRHDVRNRAVCCPCGEEGLPSLGERPQSAIRLLAPRERWAGKIAGGADVRKGVDLGVVGVCVSLVRLRFHLQRSATTRRVGHEVQHRDANTRLLRRTRWLKTCARSTCVGGRSSGSLTGDLREWMCISALSAGARPSRHPLSAPDIPPAQSTWVASWVNPNGLPTPSCNTRSIQPAPRGLPVRTKHVTTRSS